MIPIRLCLSGFTSYTEAEPADIDFRGLDLACISGSNGAGKSSLLDGITYALYGEARRRDESIINNASKRAEVTLDFEYEGQVYRVIRAITRGKGSQVDFMVRKPDGNWKTLAERTLTETNKAIERTLRIDYETFVNASFFLQGKADSFATQKPSDRKRILSSILGLDQWERYRERALELQREKTNELTLVNARLDEIQAELDLEEERKATLKEFEQQLEVARAQVEAKSGNLAAQRAQQQKLSEQRNLVALLERQLEKNQQTQAEIIEALGSKEELLSGFRAKIAQAEEIEAAYQAYLDLRKRLVELDQLAEQVKPLENERQELLHQLDLKRETMTQELSSLEAEQKAIEESNSEIKALEDDLKVSGSRLAELEDEISQKDELAKKIEALQNHSGQLREENAGLKTQMTDLKARLDSVRQVEGGSCPLCGQPLSEHNRERLARELEVEGKRMGDLHRANQAIIDENTEKQQELTQQRDNLVLKERESGTLQREMARLEQKLTQLSQQKQLWNKQKAPWLAALRAELSAESYQPEVRAQIVTLESKLGALGYEPQRHAQLRQEEVVQRVVEEDWRNLQIARSQLETLNGVVSEQRARLKNQEKEVERSQKEYEDAAAKLAADSAGLPDLRELENELTSLQENEALINQRVGAARQQVRAIDAQRERQATLRKKTEGLRAEIGNLKSLERTFGKDGVPAMLIEQALPELEDQTNAILQRLSNYTMSVNFETQEAYKDTRREDKKETLNIKISDGAATRDYETYSGGEAFRVNFAIRLALSRMLSHRAGARLQTLVIDEGFGNQDAEGRLRLVEAINLVRHDFEKILIITHIEALKDAFPSRIEVSKGPLGSKVEVIQG